MESKLTTRNVSRLYGVPYKFADIADIFCYFLFIERTKSIICSFRNVSLSRKGSVRDAGHFLPFRDCPGQSGTAGHPSRIGLLVSRLVSFFYPAVGPYICLCLSK